MSILQEYEIIRKRIGEEKFSHIEVFLASHPHYYFSDVYYRKEVYDEFEKWESEKFS